MIVLLLGLVSASFFASAQLNTPRIVYVLVDPAGACGAGPLQANIDNGKLWMCVGSPGPGTWTQISGGGGGGGDVTAVGTLTSTQIVTGAGGTDIQTPSASATVDSSGNLAVASVATGDGTAAGSVRLKELAANGSNYRDLKVSDALSADATVKFFEGTAPSNNDCLKASVTGSTYSIEGTGAACGSGSGATIPAGTVVLTTGISNGLVDLNVSNGALTRVLVVPFMLYGSGDLLGIRTILDTSGGTTAAVFGIYDSTCSTLLASKNLTSFNTSFYPTDFTFSSPLAVTPGRYYLAVTTELAVFNMSSLSFNSFYNGRLFSNTSSPTGVVATTGNARSGTGGTLALPSSCGSLSPTDEFTNVPAPVLVF